MLKSFFIFLFKIKQSTEKTSWSLICRLLKYVKPYIWHMIFSFVCMIIAALCTAFLAKSMEPIINDIFIARHSKKLLIVASQLFFIFFLRGLSTYFQSITTTYVSKNLIANIKRKLVRHLIKSDLLFFQKSSSGKLVSRIINDVDYLDDSITGTITSIGKDSITLFCLIIVMFYQDWFLSIIALFVFPIAILPVKEIGKKVRRASNRIQENIGSLLSSLTQTFQGMRLIKSYNMENYEISRLNSIIDMIFNLNFKASKISELSHPLMEVLGGIAIVVVVYYGGYQVINGNQTAGEFISFITALLLCYEPMKSLAKLNSKLQEGLASADRIFSVLDVKPLIIDKKRATNLVVEKGEIEFSGVDFSYISGEKVLNNISLKIPAGKKAALVGLSGAGKSTVLNLILRFYDPCSGCIKIDKKNINDLTLFSLRSNISLVNQEIILFDNTIYSNIAFGNFNATKEEIILAAKRAAAHDFIISLPQGYNTIVGERGFRLSGGQRQRIAIARAFLKNSQILLLDEPTSALDSKSEREIQNALNVLMRGRTTLVVAHRLSTVLDSDIIFILDNGAVIASGTHDYLFNNNEKYRWLCKVQFIQRNVEKEIKDVEAAVSQ